MKGKYEAGFVVEIATVKSSIFLYEATSGARARVIAELAISN